MLDTSRYFRQSTREGDALDFATFKSDIDDEIKRLQEVKRGLPKVITKAKKLASIMDKFLWMTDAQAATPAGKKIEATIKNLEKEVIADLERVGMLAPEKNRWLKPDWDGIRIKE